MAFFVNTVAAYVSGQIVQAALLVAFEFADQTVRVWSGLGDLAAGGETWSGIGELGSISNIESAIGDVAPQVTFSLSGVDPSLIAEALANSGNVKGRNVTVYLQFFDSAMQPLDCPYAIYLGLMDVMKVKADSPTQRIVELTSETLFTRRGVAPWGYLSSSSQRGLYPSDAGLDYMSAMQNVTTGWPWL
ncbi:hypothetical protein [Methylocella silvestris]|uniref:Uncharacterized protein n=1 Tax=Methylocella silvestris TaxID=199596 RepID=A0A2J7TJQ3_METSI|nr:hypothetical protein [Methylocella silvestris]PNG27000.1 hypothetical protein CR492_04670 [Methylocella silvestris]